MHVDAECRQHLQHFADLCGGLSVLEFGKEAATDAGQIRELLLRIASAFTRVGYGQPSSSLERTDAGDG
ncbi:hypothetical protein WH91_03265 [Devosia psychrophila]|uniref:Uncharacterized protein n=1 Tax=Devosia psychrophila TaxID=728005 RepID=A0ABR5E236_9HYPH|nr:hypothetical protein WH91_03265 [Devosia psychrophila]